MVVSIQKHPKALYEIDLARRAGVPAQAPDQ